MTKLIFKITDFHSLAKENQEPSFEREEDTDDSEECMEDNNNHLYTTCGYEYHPMEEEEEASDESYGEGEGDWETQPFDP